MAIILCLETSTEICSVALSREGTCFYESSLPPGNRHSSMLLPLISEALEKTDMSVEKLDAIALSCGPGSYTGLRVGASTAKGISYARSIPLISISSLKSMAYPFFNTNESRDYEVIIPMMDARRMEVYAGIYTTSGEELQIEQPIVLTSESIHGLQSSFPGKIILCGNGAIKCAELIANTFMVINPSEAHARNLCNMAYDLYTKKRFVDVVQFTPTYIKSPNITESKKVLV